MSHVYPIRSKKTIRKLFWEDHPELPRRRIRDYSGKGLMYPTDTRVAFSDYVDYLARSEQISQQLASEATLD